ncbi:conjugal transfer protein TraF [uncultured Rummeliibacillus sp.]|uniref:conjugal transfer protein TraF n=1 Tax=uncultured Rummeliibacillus sp. TaxID=762292 RepID=UPI00261F8C46|nr:conjugal transfer protein TraF [uncultured Rummeliibacillus sp.]
MKKIINSILLVIASISIGLAVSSVNSKASTTSSSESEITSITIPQYKKNIKKVTNISETTFLKKLKSGKQFIVFFGFKECPYCRKFSYTLNKFLKQSRKKVFYVDLDKITKKDSLKTKKMLKASGLKYTPTIEKINHQKITKTLIGSGIKLKQLNAL